MYETDYNENIEHGNSIRNINIERRYNMAARRYEISLRVLKNISRVIVINE